MTIASVPMTGASELEPALASIERSRPDALIVQPAPFVTGHVERVAALAVALRMPSISTMQRFTERGLLMSYGPDFSDAPRRVAAYAQRILQGARPADLPVERPTRFELVVNMKTAKALALAIPQPLLLRADQVIQ
jgi:putative ABC transport system substrate-binding protein